MKNELMAPTSAILPENDRDIEICERLVYKYQLPYRIAQAMGLKKAEIFDILDANKAYVDYLKREQKGLYRGKYQKLTNLSLGAIKEILSTDFKNEIKDPNGNIIGYTADLKALELKKQVAERMLESVGAIVPRTSANGTKQQINIHQSNPSVNDGKEADAKEVDALLSECKVDDDEKQKL